MSKFIITCVVVAIVAATLLICQWLRLRDPRNFVHAATAASVWYIAMDENGDNARRRWVQLTPEETAELASSFHVVDMQKSISLGGAAQGGVEFQLGDRRRRMAFTGADRLNDEIGIVYLDEAFYHKCNELLSKHAGKAIDVMSLDN